MSKAVELANEYGGMALGAAGGASLIVMLLRSIIGNASKGMLSVAADSASGDVIKHLQSEVERHERHNKDTDDKITALNMRLESMQAERLMLMQALMLSQAQATNALLIVKTMCACDTGDRERLQRALTEIIDLTLNAMHGTAKPKSTTAPAANDAPASDPFSGVE